jgi:hypothetical protein
MASKPGRRRRQRGVTYATVRRLGLALDGVEEGTSYGTAALKVRGKLMLRLKEDGETIAIRTDFDERDVLLRLDPEAFFLTDHYRDYPWVLVRLARIAERPLGDLIQGAWRRVVADARSR